MTTLILSKSYFACCYCSYWGVKVRGWSRHPRNSRNRTWILNFPNHTCLIDSVLNDTLCIVTGYLCSTPMDHLPILSGILPAELCQLRVTLSLAYHGSLDPDHILYGLLSGFSNACQERLRSRCTFVPAAQNLLNNLARLGICAFEWTNHKWKVEYCENTSMLCVFIPRTSARPVEMSLLQTAWLSSSACRLVMGDFICPCTNGVLLLH